MVEEFIEHRPLYYPSALAQITPGGQAQVLATHDQVLGGLNGHVYQGCTFPAAPEYRAEVGESAARIAGSWRSAAWSGCSGWTSSR
ncbi:hypothetical protein ACFQQB_31490 [Nonomuraea rubra]|uniref:hypothetical protein n=1 Tax=Nonomuraea rubra TaxID=46180 RepID=UPI00360B16A4